MFEQVSFATDNPSCLIAFIAITLACRGEQPAHSSFTIPHPVSGGPMAVR